MLIFGLKDAGECARVEDTVGTAAFVASTANSNSREDNGNRRQLQICILFLLLRQKLATGLN